MIYTTAIKLSDALVTTPEDDLGLDSIGVEGLDLKTRKGFKDDLSYSGFDTSLLPAKIASVENGNSPSALTSATFSNLHLVKGQTVALSYQYFTSETSASSYAFAAIGRGGSDITTTLLVDTKTKAQFNGNDTTVYNSQTITVDQTGTYNLLIGNTTVGANALGSTLRIQSITITTPDTGPYAYTQTPLGIRLIDGTVYQTNGGVLLPGGVIDSNALAAGSQQLQAASLISQDGGGIVSHDAGGIVSHDAGGIVSHDAGGLTQQAGALISQDGGGIVSHDAGGIVSHDAGGIVSHDAGGLVAIGNNAVVVATLAEKSGDFRSSPAITLPAPKSGGADVGVGEAAPSGTQQVAPQVAALTTGKSAAVWSDTLAASGSYEVRGQLFNADGTASATSFAVSTDTTSDQTSPSVTGLPGGHFVVAWRGAGGNQPAIHSQLYDSTGTKIGGEQRVGIAGLDETTPYVSATTDGGYVLTYTAAGPDPSGGNYILGQRFAYDGTPGVTFGAGTTDHVTTKSTAVTTSLKNGSTAIVYREVDTTAPGENDGLFLDIVAPDGSTVRSHALVNSSVDGTQHLPAVTTLKNGNIVVAWVDENKPSGPGLATLRAQILKPDGNRVGGEIKIADTLAGGDAPAITALADGRFTVAYDVPNVSSGTVVSVNVKTQVFSADGTMSSPVYTPTSGASERAPATVQLGNGALAVFGQRGGATTVINESLVDVGSTSNGLPTPPVTPPPPIANPSPVTLTRLTPPVDLAGQQAVGVAAGDLNGDGVADLVSVGSDSVDALSGNGDGTFALVQHFVEGGTPEVVALADLNGDGRLDAVAGTASNSIAATFLGKDGGFFADQSATTSIPAARLVFKLSAVDVTGDKVPDLVTGYNDGVFIAKGNGDGSFQTPTLLKTSAATTNVVVADLNGDGRPDFAAAEPNATSIGVFLSNGAGTYGPETLYAAGSNVTPLAVADVNGDGILDLIGANSDGNVIDRSLSVLLGKGDGTFATQIKTVQTIASVNIAVGDLNGDGFADIVSADGAHAGTITAYLGRGDGTFVAQTPVAVGGSDPTGVTLVDVNKDGKLDVVVNYSTGTGQGLDVLLNGTTFPTTRAAGAPASTVAVDTSPAGGTVAANTINAADATDASAGTHAVTYTDGFGHTVVDTLDSGNRLLGEVVSDAVSGATLSTETLTYQADGTYALHADLVTTKGSLSVDAAYGPKGQLNETTRDLAGAIVETATVTYNDDGTVGRHTVTTGRPGYDDFVYGGPAGDNAFVSHRYTDGDGNVTNYDANGNVIACYVGGTLIRTTRGDVPVEDLAVGDLVVTASGAHRPIRWLGRRSYAGRFAKSNPEVLPVCFKAGSLADNVPARDLWVSPRHAMFLDEVLVPAECLVNGVSVVKATHVDRVDYHHVELDSHDVLIAEGAMSESFVDDGARAIFQNAREHAALYPNEVGSEPLYCAPRVEEGYALEAIRQRIIARAVFPGVRPLRSTIAA